MRSSRTAAAIILAVALCAGLAEARQAAPIGARRLTTLAALRQFPGYYHLQNVLLRGEFAENGAQVAFRADEQEMRAILADGVMARSGAVEVRGQLIDVGRLEAGDPRLAKYPGPRDPERWPRPGEELVLNITAVTEAQTATTPSGNIPATTTCRTSCFAASSRRPTVAFSSRRTRTN